ncbi:MAG: aminoacyl--tRNA ligase-related protein [Candidatus Uhrbacteria bacterium]
MRYSKLFGKTRREAPRDIESVNGQLLYRAGFIDPVAAGIYSWLPLGLCVLRRVQQIVREEMDSLGCQEIIMPLLHPKEYWERTNRWGNVDVLFKVTSRTGKEYALGASHEEIVTPLVQKFVRSYRDFPLAVYQIQTKFRDELRAKGGILRGREFGMKDCYSFHSTREDFVQFYELMLAAYRRVYDRCGVASIRVRASGGVFTENVSDEFHVETPSGEDRLLRCEHCEVGFNEEVAPADRRCSTCGLALTATKGIEVGNTFDLGTKYSDACGLTFTDATGKQQPVIMGCYGIGTTRLVGAIVEAHHDDRGIIWPSNVAPFDVHVAPIIARSDAVTEEVFASAEVIVGQLESSGLSVLYDDRSDIQAGEKLADADLIGIPLRIVVSERSRAAGGIELKARGSDAARMVPDAEALSAVRAESIMLSER